MNTFEYNLARSCAPALAGLKVANLMCCIDIVNSEQRNEIKEIEKQLNSFNIKFFVIYENEDRIMFFVYREDKFIEYLSKKEVKDFLLQYNYDVNADYLVMLKQLKVRFNSENDFPHEIGVFLGYPLDDVKDFIENKKECKLVGTWKVYNNIESAKKLFEEYKNIKQIFLDKLESGEKLIDIIKYYYEVKNC